ncbi:MAG: CaiB/BaiF CoA-transferase family protein [Acidimicrobiia bacterium]|nr:CaiB/BaiF CoA-transferase family protein [Acidimicrobiia bacterium]
MTGPLAGIEVVELAGIGPVPWAATMLSDLGASVVRVDRPVPGPGELIPTHRDPMNRGRRSVAVDLKHSDGVEAVLRLVDRADVLLEGLRPGVVERLGLGPDVCRDRNRRLVYARLTGWGQEGPLASTAGHDIDYLAVAGALGSIGRAGGPPVPPVNYLADFGGGAMFAVAGVLAALVERASSGLGQVVDAAMVDGVAMLQLLTFSMLGSGLWTDRRGANLLDGGAPFYDTYECADGGFVAVGALEPQFFAALVAGLGIEVDPSAQFDREAWPALRSALAGAFLARTRDEWAEVFAGTDACVAPVLGLVEATEHAHMAARDAWVDVEGVIQPAPAPRFERTPAADPEPPRRRGADTREVLAELGYTDEQIEALVATRAVSG